MKDKTDKPKIATAGKLEIAINHFTTDITSLPYWMDSNSYIVFSLLWRRYISSSINEKLITPDGWFQYTMKSLMIHSGFRDKCTLQRAVEGLFRSGLIDVRVEAGSRLWACWKMNKQKIEYVSSIPDRDAMQEPFLNSINTISSKDKNFTYQLKKEGITELMKFFMVNPVENPPLFNTITQYHYNTTSQDNHSTSLPYNYTTLPQQDFIEEVPSKKNRKEEMEKEFEKPMEDIPSMDNDVCGVSETMTRNEEEAKENPSQSQSLDINPNVESQDSIPSGLQAEESSTQSPSEYQSKKEETTGHQEGESTSTGQPQLTVREEFDQWKELVASELETFKYATSRQDFNQKEKLFYQFYNEKVAETGFINERVKRMIDSHIEDVISSRKYVTYCKFK